MKLRNDISQLFKPLDFLKIQNARRGIYQIMMPAVFAVIIVFLQIYKQENIDIFAGNGFIAKIIVILQILVPFTIAALAAVATFPSKIMDEEIAGNPKPTLWRKVRGKRVKITLTRRQFVCLLFGYLTLLGIALLLMGIILPDVIRLLLMLSIFSQEFIYCGALIIFAFMSGNLLSNTLLGLFYLSDRIHRKD